MSHKSPVRIRIAPRLVRERATPPGTVRISVATVTRPVDPLNTASGGTRRSDRRGEELAGGVR